MAREKTSTAQQYTRFIDQALLKFSDPSRVEALKKEWLGKIDQCVKGLRLLKNENRLTPDNILQLMNQPTSITWQATGSLDPRATALEWWVGSPDYSADIEVTEKAQDQAAAHARAEARIRAAKAQKFIEILKRKGEEKVQYPESFLDEFDSAVLKIALPMVIAEIRQQKPATHNRTAIRRHMVEMLNPLLDRLKIRDKTEYVRLLLNVTREDMALRGVPLSAACVEALGDMVTSVPKAVRDGDRKIVARRLIEILRNPYRELPKAVSGRISSAAARALGKIGPVTGKVIPALRESLQDERREVQTASSQAFGEIGPPAKKIPGLVDDLLSILGRTGRHEVSYRQRTAVIDALLRMEAYEEKVRDAIQADMARIKRAPAAISPNSRAYLLEAEQAVKTIDSFIAARSEARDRDIVQEAESLLAKVGTLTDPLRELMAQGLSRRLGRDRIRQLRRVLRSLSPRLLDLEQTLGRMLAVSVQNDGKPSEVPVPILDSLKRRVDNAIRVLETLGLIEKKLPSPRSEARKGEEGLGSGTPSYGFVSGHIAQIRNLNEGLKGSIDHDYNPIFVQQNLERIKQVPERLTTAYQHLMKLAQTAAGNQEEDSFRSLVSALEKLQNESRQFKLNLETIAKGWGSRRIDLKLYWSVSDVRDALSGEDLSDTSQQVLIVFHQAVEMFQANPAFYQPMADRIATLSRSEVRSEIQAASFLPPFRSEVRTTAPASESEISYEQLDDLQRLASYYGRPLKIGIISARAGYADGVSDQIEKWAKVLIQAQHEVHALVPERTGGGYGLGAEGLRRVKALRPRLLVTLDNGITAHAALDELRAEGVDAVVVDHHHVNGQGL
ncbi:MAG: hypothetical protein NC930_04010, partial [Candidatus Omnitrophica bacterium]|nr:hypothetical protein [Candidatus Omnitrophota bacterium]